MDASSAIRSHSILLVEDDIVDVKFFKHTLLEKGIDIPVHVARDGLEALELLKGDRTIMRPLIIVLDLNMPRMNGHQFLKNLREDEKLNHHVVFVLTTSDNYNDKLDAYKMQIAGYFLKSGMPSEFNIWIDMLKNYFASVRLLPT